MRIAAHQVASVLANPAQLTGILFYGDDAGRIRDHVSAVTRAVVGTMTDPFRTSVLTRDEHTRLREEVASLALGGGRRVVRVQDATDGLASVIAGLAVDSADVLMLLEGSGLTAKSKLRTMAEKAPHWAAIACYPESGSAVSAEVKRLLGDAGLSIEPSAMAYLTQELGGDSTRRRGELEKLRLYATDMGTVTLEVAQACCSAQVDATLTAAVSAALSGQVARCDALLEELGQDGAAGPGILAVLGSQMQRILKVRLGTQGGRSAEDACRGLQPPVFPRQMAGFLQEVRCWTETDLAALGNAVREADIACKRAASPDFAIAGRLLGMVAARASAKSG